MIVSGAFKMHYDKTEAEKEAMAAQLRKSADNQLVLEKSVKELNSQAIAAEAAREEAFETINSLQEANEQARAEASDLRDKFQKHDMNMLSLRKPQLIENIINRGTKKVFNEFQTITDPAGD